MPIPMRIVKYIPERMYGFAADPSGLEVFFHLGVFDPKMKGPVVPVCHKCHRTDCISWDWASPPPILGENVLVTLPDIIVLGRAPRALRVERMDVPEMRIGVVQAFDPLRGYGFISGDTTLYHLHRSEMLDGHMPMPGNTLVFYVGTRLDRPRACHIKVCVCEGK